MTAMKFVFFIYFLFYFFSYKTEWNVICKKGMKINTKSLKTGKSFQKVILDFIFSFDSTSISL